MSADAIRRLFREKFGTEPEVVGLAPGRVNLIGEHTDYNEGFVFPAAIDRGLWIAASATQDESILYSAQREESATFDVSTAKPGTIENWGKYPAGMGWAIQHDLPNLKAVVDSSIPIGSGVSSSAAMEMAFGVVWNHLANLGISNQDLAKLGQVCENKFVGVNSGIMDQMASAMGRKGKAMFLDTRSLEITYATVPAHLAIVLLDTKKPRALTDSAYNERRSQCEEASRILGVKSLRDATMADLQSKKSEMPEVVYRRAKHVITENDRCVEFVSALDEVDVHRIGELMRGSHESLRDDYEVSCRELDIMAEAAWSAQGCVGARMTGAGFGGACVALVKADEAQAFIRETLAGYDAQSGLNGEAMVCQIADGARIVA
ncbi:galactokinase [soil metagenome]